MKMHAQPLMVPKNAIFVLQSFESPEMLSLCTYSKKSKASLENHSFIPIFKLI